MLHMNECRNLNKRYNFLGKYELLKVIQEESENINIPIILGEIGNVKKKNKCLIHLASWESFCLLFFLASSLNLQETYTSVIKLFQDIKN